jgi:hypothetical protein
MISEEVSTMTSHFLRRISALFWLVLLMPSTARSVDWKEYKSPSGKAILTVDPNSPDEKGAANYQMTVNGRQVWSGEKHFTFYDAVVTDDGLAAGYFYTHGFDGISEGGKIRITLFDSQGKTLLEDSIDRPSFYPDSPPYPFVRGLILVPDRDCFVVWMTDDETDQPDNWRVYSLSSAKLLRAFRPSDIAPKGFSLEDITDIWTVRGTPLVAVHSFIREGEHYGGRFALIDPLGGIIWSLDRPSEYKIGNNPTAESNLVREIRAHGAISESTKTDSFKIRLAASNETVTYQIVRTHGPDRWLVNETDRKPPTALTNFNAFRESVPQRPLKQNGRFFLGNSKSTPATAIHDIRAFGFDSDGAIGFIRNDANLFSFLIINQAGDVLSVITLAYVEDAHEAHCAWLGGDEWIATIGSNRAAGELTWRVNVRTEEKKLLKNLNCPSIDDLASSGDGSFVVLVTVDSGSGPEWYTSGDQIIAYDREGKKRWTIQANETQNGKCEGSSDCWLLSPEDIAVISKQEVAILDVIRENVQIYNAAGAHVSTINLESVWHRKPEYPSEISATPDGGYVIYDFEANKSLVRMSADHKVKSEIEPRYLNGRTLMPITGIHVSPDGKIWVSDGTMLLRLSEDGLVDKVLGQEPSPNRLASIQKVAADQNGNLYALDSETGAVHVFDSSGNPLHICEPSSDETPTKLSSPSLFVADPGDVYVCGISEETKDCLHFDPECKRDYSFRALPGELMATVGKDRFLTTNDVGIQIVDTSGKNLISIPRQPNKKWLNSPSSVSVAPDGSFAAFVEHGYFNLVLNYTSCAINIYKASGEPVRTIDLDKEFAYSSIAYDGGLIALRRDKEIWLMDSTGQFLQRFENDSITERGASLIIRGNELWVAIHQTGEVQRFQLP